MKLDVTSLGLPPAPDGFHWEVTKAEWTDGDNPFRFPMRSTLLVWLSRGRYSYQGYASSGFARPNARSIRRAANKALKRHHARAARNAVESAKEKRAAAAMQKRLEGIGALSVDASEASDG